MSKRKEIQDLRKAGLPYKKIAMEMEMSVGTVYYYCHSDVCKDKTYKFLTKEPLYTKWHRFRMDRAKIKTSYKGPSYFRYGAAKTFSFEELKNKIGPNPSCYLTGRKIDLANKKSYNLDHVQPASKGGSCELENCEIACKDANQAKADMLLPDFLKLCQEILIHHGYQVTEPIN